MEIEILLFLAKKGALKDFINVSSRDLADKINKSPQTAIRRLRDMKSKELIEMEVNPNSHSIKINKKGLKSLNHVFETLNTVLNKENNVIIGELVSGLGEGKYYISREEYKKRFKENLGFTPYPGTLNVMSHLPRDPYVILGDLEPCIISGFSNEDRDFGDVRCYKVKINGIEGAIVIPSRTHHPPRELEIIAPVYLRGELGLEDGDEVEVKVR